MKGVPLRPPKLRFPMAELVSPPWFWIWAEATFFKSCSPRLVINLLPPVNSWLGKPGWESAQGGQVTQQPPGRGWDGALGFTAEQHPPPPDGIAAGADGGGRALPVPALTEPFPVCPRPGPPCGGGRWTLSPPEDAAACDASSAHARHLSVPWQVGEIPIFPYSQLGRIPVQAQLGVLLWCHLIGRARVLPRLPNRLSLLLNSHEHPALPDPHGTACFPGMATPLTCPAGSWTSFPIQTPSPLCPQTFAVCPPKSWCRLPTRRWSWCWGAGSS